MRVKSTVRQSMKNQRMDFFKTAIITYLAASKILNWIDKGLDVMQSDAEGARFAIIARLIVRELPLILAVVGLVFVHKSKGRLWIKLMVGYVATIAILFAYLFIAPFFFNLLVVTPLFDLFMYYTVSYVILNLVLIGKSFLKTKTKTEEVSIINAEFRKDKGG